MKTTQSSDSKKKVGGSIDSWCGKCKLILEHTIEAMVGEKPARVHCNTCKSQHSYKAAAPVPRAPRGESSTTGTGTKTPRVRASKYQSLLQGKDMTRARKYSFSETYAAGDVMEHTIFGLGAVTAVKDGTKVEVLFESGPKVLIHGR